MARSHSGAVNGVGAISTWEGAGSAGKGRMAITESLASSNISVAVDFVKPFKAHNLNRFTLEPAGNSPKVTWAMEGTNVFTAKVMSVFVNGPSDGEALRNGSGQSQKDRGTTIARVAFRRIAQEPF